MRFGVIHTDPLRWVIVGAYDLRRAAPKDRPYKNRVDPRTGDGEPQNDVGGKSALQGRQDPCDYHEEAGEE